MKLTEDQMRRRMTVLALGLLVLYSVYRLIKFFFSPIILVSACLLGYVLYGVINH